MTRANRADIAALHDIATECVITTAQLRKAGLSAHAIGIRCRPGGPWRHLLPGVVLLSGGEPTRRQKLHAAVQRAGPCAVITGIDALRAHGISLRASPDVHVLIQAQRRTLAQGFLCLDRTARMPEPVFSDGLPFAPPARATIDLARRETDPDRLRRLLTLPVYYGLCAAEELSKELDAGNQRGSAAVREMLRSLGSMGDTYLQGVARRVADNAPLPPPSWNVTICDLRGRPIGVVDAWWDDVAMGWQFGARTDRERGPSMAHLALTAAGVVLVRTPAERLCADAEGVIRELTSAFGTAAGRKRPRIQAHGMVSAA